MNLSPFLRGSAVALVACFATLPAPAAVEGWLAWRGPEQSGVSRETGLPEKIGSKAEALWTADWGGQSTAVIANGRVYIMGYEGEGADLQEGVACFDAETGQRLWKHAYNDFLSDTIYLRYATASPAIDPETGNVYMLGTQGILAGFTPDGKRLWQRAMMEEFGRLTFPNARTASPLIDRDLLIARGITANWGNQGAASDRFYAFDKLTGETVWASSPGQRPKDNSFSHPFLTWLDGRRVLIASAGDGSVVCVNARTGDPIWRVLLGKAGINATALVHNNDKVIAIYGTPYEPGQLVAFRIPKVAPTNAAAGAVTVERSEVELWSNTEISTSTSSPILVGDRIYVVKEKGDIAAVDVNTGRQFWSFKLGIEQRNACPLYADGKIYVPILDDPASKTQGESTEAGTKGGFYILRDKGDSAELLSHIELDGRCFGSPVAWNGKIYVQTAKKFYCFGKKGNNPGLPKAVADVPWPKAGPATQLQFVPSEALLHPGETASFRARKLDAHGLFVENVADVKQVKWASYIPPTALVRATMDGKFNDNGQLTATPDAHMSAGAFEGTLDGIKGYIRGRILPKLPFKNDFEAIELSNTATNADGALEKFSFPPLPWIGARFRLDVRELEGSKVLAKTVEDKFFQRSMSFIGDAGMKDYTIQAEVRSEGTRRKMSEVGVVNQRYIILLSGNSQEMVVNSNQERLKVSVPFRWAPNAWYILKARVDIAPDGTGVVRGKAWPKGEPEPSAWNIEVPHKTAHREGSPGFFAYSPQDVRVFIDHVSVTPNAN